MKSFLFEIKDSLANPQSTCTPFQNKKGEAILAASQKKRYCTIRYTQDFAYTLISDIVQCACPRSEYTVFNYHYPQS
jgi:hypothetical protein